MKANNLSSEAIQPGQKLTLPARSGGSERRYQVQPGDTLAAIADASRVPLAALLKANGLSERTTIYPGQWLVLPN